MYKLTQAISFLSNGHIGFSIFISRINIICNFFIREDSFDDILHKLEHMKLIKRKVDKEQNSHLEQIGVRTRG